MTKGRDRVTRTYRVPEGMTEETARTRMAELLIEIRTIEADLGDREKEVEMEPGEYDGWRVRAKGAWGYLMDEYRALKNWVKDQENSGRGEALGHITSSIGLLRKGLDRVRLLEQLYQVVVEHLQEDTDESYQKMEDAVRALGGGERIDGLDGRASDARASA